MGSDDAAVILALLGCTAGDCAGGSCDTERCAGVDCASGSCGGPRDSTPSHTGTPSCVPSVVIGTGEQVWVDLNELDEVEMVHGPQGGWHVPWSARVGGTEPAVQLRGVITDVASGTVVSDVTYAVGLAPLDECFGTSIGRYGYLDVTALVAGDLDTPPELLSGHTLLLHVDATDFAGTSASAELAVIAIPDPDDT